MPDKKKTAPFLLLRVPQTHLLYVRLVKISPRKVSKLQTKEKKTFLVKLPLHFLILQNEIPHSHWIKPKNSTQCQKHTDANNNTCSHKTYTIYTQPHTLISHFIRKKTQNNKKMTWPLFEKRAQSTHYNAKEKYS
jgi:hypothetical protein